MPTSKELIEMDNKYGAHNYHPIPVVIAKAEGVWVYDPEGNKYLDCLSAYSSHNTGHRHPEIIKVLKEQADKVTLTSRAFHNDKMGPFLKQLCEVVGPHVNDPKKTGIMALPMNTGAEAVETGLKVANARVVISLEPSISEEYYAVTDSNGDYEIFNIPAGAYGYYIIKPDSTDMYKTEYWESMVFVESGKANELNLYNLE